VVGAAVAAEVVAEHGSRTRPPDTISRRVMQSFYREIVLDHFQRPRNRHDLEDANLEEHIDNPLCGDHVTVYANLQNDTFEEVSFTGRGCSISQASASMLTEQLTGTGREEAEERIEAFLEMMRTQENEDLGELAALKSVVQTPSRIRCATLAWEAMRRALH
jgi:nitrogen fixation protein NifU and related proteins